MQTDLFQWLRSKKHFLHLAISSVLHRPQENLLYFLHIPKTCGTTFDFLLRNKFSLAGVSPITCNMMDFYLTSEKISSTWDYISGHLNFGYYIREISNRPVTTVTLLREPRSLILSIYKFILESPEYSLHQYVIENCATLETFLHDPVISAHIDNWQTKFLGYHERQIKPEDIAVIKTMKHFEAERYLLNCLGNKPMPDNLLHSAIDRLRQCNAVGISEQLLDSANMVAKLLGWQQFASIPRLQESSNKMKAKYLPLNILKRMDELSILDRQLYDVGKSMHKSMIEGCYTSQPLIRAA